MRRPIARDINQRRRAVSTPVSLWARDFTPLSLGPALWLDASDTTTITESGGVVSQWNDKSGNGRNVSQATLADRPTTGLNTLNDRNVVTFNSDWLSVAAPLSVANLTVFAVARMTGTTNDSGLVVFAKAGQSDTTNVNAALIGMKQTYSNTTTYSLRSSRQAGGPAGAGAPPWGVYAYRLPSNGGEQAFSESFTGTPLGSTTATWGTCDSILIGSRNFTGVPDAPRLVGDIAEVIAFTSALSDYDLNYVGSYLSRKWGFVWTVK